MALRRALSKRPFKPHSPSPTTTHFRREFFTSPDSSGGFLRRFLQRRAINIHSSSPFALRSLLTIPAGENLREKLRSLNDAGDRRLRLDGLRPPAKEEEEEGFRVGPEDVKRVMRFVQMERVRERLRNISASTILYGEFSRVCGEVCGNKEIGLEYAKALDDSGNVVVLGRVVFLHPEQVAKSMERLISQSIAMPNDPRRKELDNLENQKASIDQRAQSMVRRELYYGLGFMILQTLGFMRLTFWELSWDVMEPICFFVTSLHFALAYAFFLRTSKEPSFEGYFQRRFKVKQMKLMKSHNFDVKRYNQLCETFYPGYRK